MSNYYVAVDANGQAYIAHALFGTKKPRQDVKYTNRIEYKPGKFRYFYSDAEYQRYLKAQQLGSNVKGAAQKVGSSVGRGARAAGSGIATGARAVGRAAKSVPGRVRQGIDTVGDKLGFDERQRMLEAKAGYNEVTYAQRYREYMDTPLGKIENTVRKAGDSVKRAAETVRKYASESFEKVKAWAEDTGGKARDWAGRTGEKVGDKARQVGGQVRDAGGRALGTARDAGSRAVGAVKDAGSRAIGAAREAGGRVRDFAVDKQLDMQQNSVDRQLERYRRKNPNGPTDKAGKKTMRQINNLYSLVQTPGLPDSQRAAYLDQIEDLIDDLK